MYSHPKLIKKDDLHKLYNLWFRQPWILEKDESLYSLFKCCASGEERNLIIDLLYNFHYLSNEVLNQFLNIIADFIINQTGFLENKIQIACFTKDDDADSSQKFLDYIKMKLFERGWSNFQMSNRFGAAIKNYNKGFTQIIFIDEFLGSGKTLRNRIKVITHELKTENLEMKFCFLAGMKYVIQKEEFSKFEIFCPLILDRGISDRFKGEELSHSILLMYNLEKTLASKINDHKIEDYSFGYGYAEALYSAQGILGNTPNSVFPIFWWPRNNKGKPRKTMLTRFEKTLL